MTEKETIKFLKMIRCEREMSRSLIEEYFGDSRNSNDELAALQSPTTPFIQQTYESQVFVDGELQDTPDDTFMISDDGINCIDHSSENKRHFWIPVAISVFATVIALLALVFSLRPA